MGAGASANSQKGPSLYSNSKGTNGLVNCKLLVVGLDNSGKSSVISHMKNKCNNNKKNKASTEAVEAEVVPTVGLRREEFCKGSFNFTIIDMSGQSRYRELWNSYYSEVDGVIFVLDSTDKIRMCVSKNEMDMMLEHEDMARRNIPLLFYVNKMDLPGAMDPVEVKDLLDLEKLKKVRHS